MMMQNVQKNKQSSIKAIPWLKIFGYLFLIVIAICYLYPIFIMICNSLKTSEEIRKSGLALPNSFFLENYAYAYEKANIGRLFINSFVVTGLSLALIFIINVLTAYPFARFAFKGKSIIFVIILSGIMFPIQMAIIPLFKIITTIHLVNSPFALVFPYAAFSLPIGVYILSNYMRSVPIELDEAAKIDGCGSFKMLWKIMLPIIKPATATVLITNAITVWNDLLLPVIVMTKPTSKTLPSGLMFFQGQYSNSWEYLTAAIVMISLPMIIFFLLLQKDIVNGLAAGSVKA